MVNPEDELRDATIQMWNELKDRIERNKKRLEEKEQDIQKMDICINRINFRLKEIEDNIEKSSKILQIQTNTLKNGIIEAINRIKGINDDKLKHIAEFFIRKAVEIRLDSLDKEFQEETKKQLQPLINSMKERVKSNLDAIDKHTIYAKKFFRNVTKQEKKEVIELKKEAIKKKRINKSKKNDKMGEESENATQIVTPEPNSI